MERCRRRRERAHLPGRTPDHGVQGLKDLMAVEVTDCGVPAPERRQRLLRESGVKPPHPQCGGLGGGFEGFCEIPDHVDDGFVADRGINHGVIGSTVGPFMVKIFLDEIGAIAVDGIHELFGFGLTLAVG